MKYKMNQHLSKNLGRSRAAEPQRRKESNPQFNLLSFSAAKLEIRKGTPLM